MTPARRRLVGALAAATAIAAAWWLAPVAAWADALADWLRGAGWQGVALFSLLYVLSALVLAPATIPTLVAGWIWGLGWGALLVHAVGMVADTIPFLLARRYGRGRLAGALGLGRHAGTLRAFDRALERDGFWLVCLLRWFPLAPFNLMNYLLGLSRVSTRDYLWATFLACIPNTLVFVYLGTVIPRVGAYDGLLGSEPLVVAALAALGVLSLVGLSLAARAALDRRVRCT